MSGVEMPDGQPCGCEPHAEGPFIVEEDDPDGIERCETCGGWRDRA